MSWEISPPGKEPGPRGKGPANAEQSPTTTSAANYATSSQQVSWWSVHTHVAPLLEEVGSWPMAGTPAWCELGDDEPTKISALYDAARHHILRVETAQQALADASREVSAAADWSAVAKEFLDIETFYAARPWMRRETSHD